VVLEMLEKFKYKICSYLHCLERVTWEIKASMIRCKQASFSSRLPSYDFMFHAQGIHSTKG